MPSHQRVVPVAGNATIFVTPQQGGRVLPGATNGVVFKLEPAGPRVRPRGARSDTGDEEEEPEEEEYDEYGRRKRRKRPARKKRGPPVGGGDFGGGAELPAAPTGYTEPDDDEPVEQSCTWAFLEADSRDGSLSDTFTLNVPSDSLVFMVVGALNVSGNATAAVLSGDLTWEKLAEESVSAGGDNAVNQLWAVITPAGNYSVTITTTGTAGDSSLIHSASCLVGTPLGATVADMVIQTKSVEGVASAAITFDPFENANNFAFICGLGMGDLGGASAGYLSYEGVPGFDVITAGFVVGHAKNDSESDGTFGAASADYTLAFGCEVKCPAAEGDNWTVSYSGVLWGAGESFTMEPDTVYLLVASSSDEDGTGGSFTAPTISGGGSISELAFAVDAGLFVDFAFGIYVAYGDGDIVVDSLNGTSEIRIMAVAESVATLATPITDSYGGTNQSGGVTGASLVGAATDQLIMSAISLGTGALDGTIDALGSPSANHYAGEKAGGSASFGVSSTDFTVLGAVLLSPA